MRALAFTALALCLAACGTRAGDGVGDAEGEGPYSVETIRAIDAASRETGELLLRRQRPDGSWGDAAATALAVEALSSFEPAVPAYAAAAGKGVERLLKRGPRGDAENYAMAYALAAVTLRPSVSDHAGLLSRERDLREGFERALERACGDFQEGVLLNALGKTGLAPERLKALAEASARKPRPRAACSGRRPDPTNATARAFAAEILDYNAGLPGPGGVKEMFDDLIRREELRARYPSGPLGLDGLLWTTAGFREMRFRLVEPARGCYFSADLLGRRVLELRGKDGTWGDDFAAASAMIALVNLRRTFESALPYEITR